MSIKKYNIVFLLFLLGITYSCSQQLNQLSDFEKDSIALCNMIPVEISQLEIPQTDSFSCVISHTGFTLMYDEIHKQSAWVAYELTKQKTTKITGRRNRFTPDPKLKLKSPDNKDYKKSGYDRGHLAPAADMAWSVESMKESFYYTNISPQIPSFNRGIWKKLEDLVRIWAVENEHIYVITGPVLDSNFTNIGDNKVTVPEAFYKVILDYTLPEIKAIAFIIPNQKGEKTLYEYAVSVKEVEEATGIDFFPQLPDCQEEIIERTVCKSLWTWR